MRPDFWDGRNLCEIRRYNLRFVVRLDVVAEQALLELGIFGFVLGPFLEPYRFLRVDFGVNLDLGRVLLYRLSSADAELILLVLFFRLGERCLS